MQNADLIEELNSCGGKVDDDEVVLCLLRSLPSKYDTMKIMLRTRGKPVLLNELQTLLLSEDKNILEAESKEILYVNTTRRM